MNIKEDEMKFWFWKLRGSIRLMLTEWAWGNKPDDRHSFNQAMSYADALKDAFQRGKKPIEAIKEDMSYA
jgi:hypothetical protein